MKQNQIIKDHLAHIQYEKTLVLKGKTASNLVKLLDDLQLHEAVIAGDYKAQILLLHIDSYMLQCDYVGLKLLLQRKSKIIEDNTELLKLLKGICDAVRDQNLGYLIQLGFTYASTKNNRNLKELIKASFFRFCFNTMSKYFINIPLKDAEKILKIDKKSLIQWALQQGHSVDQQFMVFNAVADSIDIEQIEKQMKHKLNQIALISSVISKYQ